jgi:1-acyl-sn-glycerol-3-phosphate acyltransferase
MAEPWRSIDEPDHTAVTATGLFRAVLRGIPLLLLVFGCLLVLLLVRCVEKPVHGAGRPWTPHITQFVCRNAFRIMGIGFETKGQVMAGPGAVVANHSSWLDIFALNAAKRIYFVSKDEVASWPGIGWLARATGTVFIKRDRREAVGQVSVFQERLALGHKLLFFPEGTSTDGLQVLPFKPTLFAAFFDDALKNTMSIQPVAVQYHAPAGTDPRFYGWWGDMALAPHLYATLAAKQQGRIVVVYQPPLKVADHADRKQLAAALETQVRAGLADHRLT